MTPSSDTTTPCCAGCRIPAPEPDSYEAEDWRTLSLADPNIGYKSWTFCPECAFDPSRAFPSIGLLEISRGHMTQDPHEEHWGPDERRVWVNCKPKWLTDCTPAELEWLHSEIEHADDQAQAWAAWQAERDEPLTPVHLPGQPEP